MNSIIFWNGAKPIREVAQSFETFSVLIDFFQSPEKYYQGGSRFNLDDLMRRTKLDIQGKSLHRLFAIVSPLTKQQMLELLESIIQDNELIRITYTYEYNFHVAGLFKHGNNYYYYDPNAKYGEAHTTSLDEIVTLINTTNENYGTIDSPLAFEVFSFGKNQSSHLNQSEFFQRAHIQTTEEALILSAYIGADESTKFYLTKGMAIDSADQFGRTALMYAASNGHLSVVKTLLDSINYFLIVGFNSQI